MREGEEEREEREDCFILLLCTIRLHMSSIYREIQ